MDISMFVMLLTVFVLACFVGYHVIWGVTASLHTPLMAVSNAISGIVIVGALYVAGATDTGVVDAWRAFQTDGTLPVREMLGTAAVILASINIFGGFAVTRRMLAMYRKKGEK